MVPMGHQGLCPSLRARVSFTAVENEVIRKVRQADGSVRGVVVDTSL